MENFTKNSLKAAVAKYGSLHTDGKAEADVKAELVSDERGFTPEQIDEIYAAIVATPDLFEQGGDKGGDQEDLDNEDKMEDQEIPEWAALKLIGIFKPLFDELKEEIVELRKSLAKSAKEATPNAVFQSSVEFDPETDYIVAAGKSFRDPKDFTKEYAAGDDVTHLGADKLLALLSNGLIEEA